MEGEKKVYYKSILTAGILAGLFSLIPLWHLIIIPGIIAGNFHLDRKKGAKSGAIGVLIAWIIYIFIHIIFINAYLLLDQFGALLISSGFGWLILIIILLMGIVFGALGGALGSEARILMKENFYEFIKRKLSPRFKREKATNETKKSKVSNKL